MNKALIHQAVMAEKSDTEITDAEISEALTEISLLLDDLQQQMQVHATALSQGFTLAQLCELPEDFVEDKYRVAHQLFTAGRANECLPVAIWLSAVKPSELRFHFMTGMCLQQLGEPQAAARFYAQSLVINDKDIAVVFRLAECMMAMGDSEHARLLFEMVMELGREDESRLRLQQISQQHMVTLH